MEYKMTEEILGHHKIINATNLDVISDMVNNNWLELDNLREVLEHLSIEPEEFISYCQDADWIEQDLINDIKEELLD